MRVVAFFWALVLGFTGGRTRSLAGLRRAYEESTGSRLAPSAFYDRFTPALARMLKAVVGDLLTKVGRADSRPGRSAGRLPRPGDHLLYYSNNNHAR